MELEQGHRYRSSTVGCNIFEILLFPTSNLHPILLQAIGSVVVGGQSLTLLKRTRGTVQ
jgi:hypothetical protein